MSEHTRTHLKHLQQLDTQIATAKQAVQDFDPLFEEVEEPALALESELNTTKSRLQEMKLAERRLELASEEKGSRVTRLEERLGTVRNLREEAAVSTELDMVKRALQSDEQEAMTLLDQVRKMEDRLEEVEAAYAEAQVVVGPAREELIAKRDGAKDALASLETERETFTANMEPGELRMYEAIQKGGRRVAVAELTEDGACGNCFGMVPLQLKNEILHGSGLIRCEACGVILAAPDPDAPAEEAPAPVQEAAVDESADDDAVEGDDNEAGDGEETTEEVSAEG